MRLLTRSLLTFFAFLFLFGCAAKQINTPKPFDAVQFDQAAYSSKVDNFLIIFDASSSMRHPTQQESKFDMARALVEQMNSTLPEMGQTAGIRTFGHSPRVSKNSTDLIYGMEKYSTTRLNKNFKKVFEPGGISPLYKATDAAQGDFNGLSGESNAVIIITDGEDLPGNVLASAKALKDLYGPSICFYPILVGDSLTGASVLKQIASIGGCGFYSTAGQLLNNPAAMGSFVETVFLDKKPAPAAPAAPAVVTRKDTDKDGVYDDEDQCPGTPIGATVNPVGCWVLDDVLFGSGKAVVKPGGYALLDSVARILEQNPVMGIDIQGHTDNVGSEASNKDLSLRRAHAVKNYLIGKGILKNRMTTEGFGFSKPVALNGTDAGRALNRRVEIQPF
ncbi:OmpA family protein [Desulfobacula sp.]